MLLAYKFWHCSLAVLCWDEGNYQSSNCIYVYVSYRQKTPLSVDVSHCYSKMSALYYTNYSSPLATG